ncbi:MAG: nucleotidyltransferase domain-containing protein [Fimbriimonadales bacterium]
MRATTTGMELEVDRLASELPKILGDNLVSLVLYGSAARGDADPETSDINLMIVLEATTPAAHKAIREVLAGPVRVEPLVVQKSGFDRAQIAFALKFLSIRRNFRVLHGANLLDLPEVSTGLMRFLSEQEIRNFRMRLTNVYVACGNRPQRYAAYLRRTSTSAFVVLSDVLRTDGHDLPDELAARLSVFDEAFGADSWALRRLLELKNKPSQIAAEADDLHAGLVSVLAAAIAWLEERWPEPRL